MSAILILKVTVKSSGACKYGVAYELTPGALIVSFCTDRASANVMASELAATRWDSKDLRRPEGSVILNLDSNPGLNVTVVRRWTP